jgi:hypothetical protein
MAVLAEFDHDHHKPIIRKKIIQEQKPNDERMIKMIGFGSPYRPFKT